MCCDFFSLVFWRKCTKALLPCRDQKRHPISRMQLQRVYNACLPGFSYSRGTEPCSIHIVSQIIRARRYSVSHQQAMLTIDICIVVGCGGDDSAWFMIVPACISAIRNLFGAPQRIVFSSHCSLCLVLKEKITESLILGDEAND